MNENSESQIFFIAPKNAYDPQSFDLTQVNYHMMSALVQAQAKIALQPASLADEILSTYHNYFFQRAIASASVKTVFHSLKGLKFLKSQIFLENTGDHYLVADADGGVNTLRYQCKDAFGKPAKIK